MSTTEPFAKLNVMLKISRAVTALEKNETPELEGLIAMAVTAVFEAERRYGIEVAEYVIRQISQRVNS